MKNWIKRKFRELRRNITEERIEGFLSDLLRDKLKDKKIGRRVSSYFRKPINYVKIDLRGYNNWDKDSKAFTLMLGKSISDWLNANKISIPMQQRLSHISFHLVLDGEACDYNESYELFPGVPAKETHIKRVIKLSRWQRLTTSIWTLPTIISITLTSILLFFSVLHFANSTDQELLKISTITQNINFVTGIFGSFIMTFLMTRVLNLRQEKLKRAPQIKQLSEKLSLFRRICYQLLNDHRFWKDSTHYKYAKSIVDIISYEESKGQGETTDVEFQNYKAIITAPGKRIDIIWLYLQLNLFVDFHPIQNLNLLYTEHPPLHIYTIKEIERYLEICDRNELVNYLDKNSAEPEFNSETQFATNIVQAAKLFDKTKYGEKSYSAELLTGISTEVELHVLPTLFYLLKLNENNLPLSIRYYFSAVVSILVLTVIWPTIYVVFFENALLLNISSIILLGIFVHILFMLKVFLKNENTLLRPDDYR